MNTKEIVDAFLKEFDSKMAKAMEGNTDPQAQAFAAALSDTVREIVKGIDEPAEEEK